MTKNKRISAIAAILTALFIALSLTVCASNEEITEDCSIEAEKAWDAEEIDSTESHSSEEQEDTAEGGTQESSDYDNIFDDIYNELLKNADKIFAALAFIGTMIVSFAYKKGLIPMLSGAVTALKGTVDSIKHDGVENAKSTGEKISSIESGVRDVLCCAESSDKSIEEISKRLDTLDSVINQYESMRTILSAQVDMLYAIFTCSALPEYQKEAVGARIKLMREELEKNEKSEE